MNLPMLDELYLAPKLSRPDSGSRSLPVMFVGHRVVMVAVTAERCRHGQGLEFGRGSDNFLGMLHLASAIILLRHL